MFDDGNRMDDMQWKCNDYVANRLRELLQQHPTISPEQIGEFVRAAIDDFWLLHTGRRAEVSNIVRDPGRAGEEG